MEATLEHGALTVALTGHIDSSNAPAAEAELMAVRDREPHEAMVLDLQDLTYISSAGLRIVLRLRKLEPALKLVNASAEVYEILDMTGFTEMMPVEKAYRTISIEGCEVIGRGANGTVYRIDQDTVVKVYRSQDCLPDVQRERELARKAFVLGIPTAIPYDVVRVGDSFGSVFELLNSRSFSKLIAANPEDMDHYVGLYVDLMEKIHGTHVKEGDLPSIRPFADSCVLYAKKELPEALGAKAEALVNAIPDTDTMLHGDFHTNNIVMQNDEVLILDMDTLCVGHPIFELGSMYMAFVGFGELDPTVPEAFLKLPYATTQLIWEKALLRYAGGDEALAARTGDRARIICYLRLLRRSLRRGGRENPESRAWIELCLARLTELLPRVDALYE